MRSTPFSISVVRSSSANSMLSATTIWSGAICTVRTPFAAMTPGSARARSPIAAAIAGSARSPISRPLVSRATSADVRARTAPIRIDAKPSIQGRPSAPAAKVPSAAMTIPISAAVSSSRTMKVGGSLLRRNACQ